MLSMPLKAIFTFVFPHLKAPDPEKMARKLVFVLPIVFLGWALRQLSSDHLWISETLWLTRWQVGILWHLPGSSSGMESYLAYREDRIQKDKARYKIHSTCIWRHQGLYPACFQGKAQSQSTGHWSEMLVCLHIFLSGFFANKGANGEIGNVISFFW